MGNCFFVDFRDIFISETAADLRPDVVNPDDSNSFFFGDRVLSGVASAIFVEKKKSLENGGGKGISKLGILTQSNLAVTM